jgi:hypothetical protein
MALCHRCHACLQVAVAAAAHQMQSKESFFKSLPKSTFGFLSAVAFDQFLMLGYALVLITSGSNTSAYYFAACIVLFAFALVYFSLSAVRPHRTEPPRRPPRAPPGRGSQQPFRRGCRCAPRTRSSCSPRLRSARA